MKRHLLVIIVLVTMFTGSCAQNLSVRDIEAVTGTSLSEGLVICTEGLVGMTALQFNLSLPKGITLDENRCSIGKENANHELVIRPLANGDYLFVFYSMDKALIADGELMRIGVRTGSTAIISNGELYNVRVATTDAVSHVRANSSFAVKVTDHVIVTADDQMIVYGDDVPALTYKIEGAELNGTPQLSTTATRTSPVGTYPIVLKKGTVTNNNDSYANGTLTITKAPLTVTAKSYTIKQGDALPDFEVNYSGFKNNETASVLTKKATATCAATSWSGVGTYEINVSGAIADNYDFSYVKGTLTITEADPFNLIYMVDGNVYNTYQVKYGAAITPEANPTKEGYTFSGWSLIPTTMPAKDVIVTGTFTKGQYKLVYMVDGQTYKTISIDYGVNITPEKAPEREGYTFSGWSEIPAKMPAKDVTVTGSFTINKYKLVYLVDGKTYKTYEVEYGASITPEAQPKKEGYTFSGWDIVPANMPAYDVTVNGSFTFIDAIEDVIADDGTYQIFTLDGKLVETMQKGVNIIRFSNGTTKSVYVK